MEIPNFLLGPAKDERTDFCKHPIGGNRGRGQVYPDESTRVIVLCITLPLLKNCAEAKEEGGFNISIERNDENYDQQYSARTYVHCR